MEKTKELTFIKSGKYILAMLICLILVSPLVTSGIETVQAYVPPGGWPEGQPHFTLYAALSTDPYYGWLSGYHDIMYAIKDELAKIGIDLILTFWDSGTIWDTCWRWESYWDKPGEPPTGWDLTTTEWYMLPHGLLRAASLVLNENTPPYGYNIMPWLNPKADTIYKMAEAELDPVKRKDLLWKWQEIFMHDCPMINVYYGKLYEVTAAYLEGWDPIVRFHDDSHLWLNNTVAERPGVLTYGADESVYDTNPMFMVTCTQEIMTSLTHDCLYKATRDPWPLEINETVCDPNHPNYHKYPYVVRPDLAAAPPTYLDGGRTVIVPLRNDVYWVWPNGTKSEKFDAWDVKFTFDAVLDPATVATGYGDLAPVIGSVDVINETAVRFNLRRPHADFELLLANMWGTAIVPEHVLGDIPYSALRIHPTNWDPSLLPGTGSFVFKDWVPDVRVTLDKNPWYWGNQTGTIDKVIIKYPYKVGGPGIPPPPFPDFELRDPIIASKEFFEELNQMDIYRVWQYLRPASNLIILNLNNPILANRYVRQAIAHAIPYDRIRDEVLPGWGVEGIRAKTIILPYHYYKGEHLYHPTLEPYEYNLTKAQQYMDMWIYCTDPLNWDKGPVGDADQSGIVDLTDWGIWRARIGTVTTPIDIYPAWPFVVDPDFNNDNDVDLDDVWLWAINYGKEYPFPGAK